MNTTVSRLRRTLPAGLIAAAVVFPVSAAASPDVPAPKPVPFSATAAPHTRYAANLDNIAEAARMAQDAGRTGRAAKLRAMAAGSGGGRFLAFDGRGKGRAVEVLGDLESADHVTVLVPGSDTTLDTYQRFRAGAVALEQRLQAEHPNSAVVAWLGYDTPTVSTTVLTTSRADGAAAELGPFLSDVEALSRPDTRISLLCHSYGSVVCARTRTGPKIADLVLYGSPGTGADSAAALPTRAQVWSGRGSRDWIGRVPHVRLGGVGFGTDPVDRAFGARSFNAGDAGHSDYLKPGTASLDSLARIVLGPPPTATPPPAPASVPASPPTPTPALASPPATMPEVRHA
ncbi:alpha/beta hydrolase [Streptomyces sp. NPDC046557]|uniref:alpha/beta hydrolase n=1 Tax=Streptomyces sp. NPDC046557 TaxID=3155372 RepID=UPI0033C078CB